MFASGTEPLTHSALSKALRSSKLSGAVPHHPTSRMPLSLALCQALPPLPPLNLQSCPTAPPSPLQRPPGFAQASHPTPGLSLQKPPRQPFQFKAWTGWWFLRAWASPLSPPAWVPWTRPLETQPPSQWPPSWPPNSRTPKPLNTHFPSPVPVTFHLLVFGYARNSWVIYINVTHVNKKQKKRGVPFAHHSDSTSPVHFPAGPFRL